MPLAHARADVAHHELHQRPNVSGQSTHGAIPLDAVLGNQDFLPGFKPRVGGRHIRVVALSGFPPFSHAELATFLSELPISYRYSIRAIPLPIRTSVCQIGVHRRNWFQKRKGARAIISETIGSGDRRGV